MPETLVVRMSENVHAPVEWTEVNQTGQVIQGSHGYGTLNQAAEVAPNKKVVVLIPATQVLITHAAIPPARGSKLLQVLPYALEEQLAEDVEDLHFAIGPQNDDKTYLAAAVRREVIQTWQEILNDAGLYPKAIVPDSIAMPTVPGSNTSILVDGQLVIVKKPGQAPMSFGDLHLQDVTQLLELGADPENPDDVTVFVTEEEQPAVAATLETLRRQVSSLDVQLLADGVLPHLAVRAAGPNALNMLQGQYAPSTSMGKYWQPWRFAASLAAGLLAITIVGKFAEGLYLSSQETQLAAQIDVAFKEAFPGVRQQADLRRQVESMTGGPAKTSEGSTFLKTVETVAGSMSAAGKSELVDINFRNGIMNLKINAPDTVTLESLKDKISETGLFQVTIAGANPRDDGVEGRLEVKKAGS